ALALRLGQHLLPLLDDPARLLDLLGDRGAHLVEDVVDLLAVDPHLVGQRHGLRVVDEVVELVDEDEDVHVRGILLLWPDEGAGPSGPHSPGFSGVPGLPSGKSTLNRAATGSGTSSDTSPPNAAISFTPLDETKLTCGLAITYTVSMSGARWRLSWFIWNSHSKSEMTRRPLTITFASHLRAKSTTSSRKTSISTLPRPESASRRNSTRSSTVKVGSLWCGVLTAPTPPRSTIPA